VLFTIIYALALSPLPKILIELLALGRWSRRCLPAALRPPMLAHSAPGHTATAIFTGGADFVPRQDFLLMLMVVPGIVNLFCFLLVGQRHY